MMRVHAVWAAVRERTDASSRRRRFDQNQFTFVILFAFVFEVLSINFAILNDDRRIFTRMY